METILRFLNARTFAVAGIAVALVVLGDRYQGIPRQWWQERADAAARGKSGLAAPIAEDLDRKESLRLRALHKAVSEEIAVAAAKGFDVARLQSIADKALALDTPAYRPAALERLNKLRLVIPQSIEPFRPAAAGEEPPDRLPTPTAAPRAKTRRTR
ncbi:MAG: hypothetical protein HY079_14465 [Elusimicrobia bacterium]|nr:hypothetical protein [Elusimicrobiota bacterium]